MSFIARLSLAAVLLSVFIGCGENKVETTKTGGEKAKVTKPASKDGPCTKGDQLPKELKEGKRLWASNYLYAKAPELAVEKWLSDKPDTKGKYVLYEFWWTWCPPCRKSIALLNDFHKKFSKDEIVFIVITDETEDAVKAMTTKYPDVEPIECYSAIDSQARMIEKLGVFGRPHAIIVEPEGYVIWQGFPYLKGYELTEQTIEKILAIGRKLKKAKK